MFAVEILLLFNTEHCIHFTWSLCIPSVFMSQTAKTVLLSNTPTNIHTYINLSTKLLYFIKYYGSYFVSLFLK